MKKIRNIAFIMLVIVLSSCSSSKSDKEIILLKGQFSEITIIQEMAKILIEDNTDLKVKFHDSMNTVAASKALQDKNVDLYISYDGTLLATILQKDISDVPQDSNLFDYANKIAQEKKKLSILNKFGFENTYAIAVKKDTASKYNLKKISDLTKVSDQLIFGAEHEFFDEEGSVRFNPFNKAYSITWKDNKSLDLGLKYAAIDNKNIDVTIVYSTDGLNKKSDLVILEDDLKFFPEYNGSFFYRTTLFDEYKDIAPNLKDVLSKLDGKIDNATMIQLNYEVDANNKKPSDVAEQFLIDNNIK